MVWGRSCVRYVLTCDVNCSRQRVIGVLSKNYYQFEYRKQISLRLVIARSSWFLAEMVISHFLITVWAFVWRNAYTNNFTRSEIRKQIFELIAGYATHILSHDKIAAELADRLLIRVRFMTENIYCYFLQMNF